MSEKAASNMDHDYASVTTQTSSYMDNNYSLHNNSTPAKNVNDSSILFDGEHDLHLLHHNDDELILNCPFISLPEHRTGLKAVAYWIYAGSIMLLLTFNIIFLIWIMKVGIDVIIALNSGALYIKLIYSIVSEF